MDEIIVFKPLGEERLREIVGLLLDNVRTRLAESRISPEVTDAARTFIAREGHDPIYGARPLRRAIQRLIENPLAKRILAGDFPPGSTVRVDVADNERSSLRKRPHRPRARLNPSALVQARPRPRADRQQEGTQERGLLGLG